MIACDSQLRPRSSRQPRAGQAVGRADRPQVDWVDLEDRVDLTDGVDLADGMDGADREDREDLEDGAD